MNHVRDQSGALRVAIVGCGAVAERYHMPIIAGHENAQLSALVDRNVARARELAQAYEVPLVAQDLNALNASNTDAVILCTPPFHHAPAALELLSKGIHVLVEKPIATNAADAKKMVQMANAHHAVLSVAVFRRLLPSLRLLKNAIDSNLLGPPISCHVQGGSVYGWEAVSLGNMLKSQAGGGVLMDMGPHYFDQLLYLFDGPSQVLEYHDDSLGGIEANCVAKLRLNHSGSPVEGTVEISRTHALPNEFVVKCRDGDLVIPPSDRYRVLIRKKDWHLHDSDHGSGTAEFSMAWDKEPETLWLKNFRDEIDDWFDAIEHKTQPKLSGESALPVMKLIDDCYTLRQGMSHSWESHPLIDRKVPSDAKVLDKPRKVLITGASGFIGCRLAEILSQRTGYQVRSAVHNPANASRIARLDTEMVQADLGDYESVQRLVAGCDAIVHCAIGTETGNARRVFEITVGGTKNLLRAAQASGLEHLVHISTIAVHSEHHTGTIDEQTPTQPGRGNTYGESKLAAELAVRNASVPFTVIRPGCVYGPYGKTFINNPIRAMAEGRLVLTGAEHTPSNTVYVDSLCEAIVRSLENKISIGKTYALADDDGMTWGEFYRYFANRFGMEFRTEPQAYSPEGSRNRKSKSKSGTVFGLAKSQEAKELLKAFAWQTDVGSYARQWLESKPTWKRQFKKLAGLSSAAIYRPESAEASKEPLRILPRSATVRSELARRELGWQPMIARQKCLRLVGDWLEYAQIVTPSKNELPKNSVQ
jgi:predicted dehydrogenase/nucleoside-diphosphate-sugar epimerase